MTEVFITKICSLSRPASRDHWAGLTEASHFESWNVGVFNCQLHSLLSIKILKEQRILHEGKVLCWSQWKPYSANKQYFTVVLLGHLYIRIHFVKLERERLKSAKTHDEAHGAVCWICSMWPKYPAGQPLIEDVQYEYKWQLKGIISESPLFLETINSKSTTMKLI